MGLRCKRCGSKEQVKDGFMRGKQPYRCKACGLNFTDTPARGMPLTMKVKAILLYVSGLSMNRTAKLLRVSTPTIQAWLEQFAEVYAQKPEPEGHAVVVELDEMWHYLKKLGRQSRLLGVPFEGGEVGVGIAAEAGSCDAGSPRMSRVRRRSRQRADRPGRGCVRTGPAPSSDAGHEPHGPAQHQRRARPPCGRCTAARGSDASRTAAPGRCWSGAGPARRSSGTAPANSSASP